MSSVIRTRGIASTPCSVDRQDAACLVPFDGSPALAEALLRAAWDEGLLLFTAGASPTRIRLLLPVNSSDEELEAGFAMLEKALRRVAAERGIAC